MAGIKLFKVKEDNCFSILASTYMHQPLSCLVDDDNVTMTTITTQPITLSLAHARGVIRAGVLLAKLFNRTVYSP